MMKNKTVIVTGGNAGIGYETALGIAKLGATTYIVSRDETKAKAAVEQLKAESHNLAIDYFIADFSSQKSVRQVAETIKQKLTVIDVLVNNAGGVYPSFALSEDGLEMTIATNHFGPFLLTNLLLPLIEKSSEGRIVNVSSRSHYRGKIDFESFTKEKGYFVMKAYEQSKLANVLFTCRTGRAIKVQKHYREQFASGRGENRNRQKRNSGLYPLVLEYVYFLGRNFSRGWG
jgi:retinol dehydrogenase-12